MTIPVYILTYGRPDKVHTINSLRSQGFTGKIYLVCSTDDKKLNEYKSNHENVIVFDKNIYRGSFDIGDNFNDNRVVVFARNARRSNCMASHYNTAPPNATIRDYLPPLASR